MSMPALTLPLPSFATAPGRGRLLRLRAARLATGAPGEVVADGAVLVDGDRIIAAGPDSEVPRPHGAEAVTFDGATLLPGLIDAHVHLCFAHGEDLVASPGTVSGSAAFAQAARAARLVLRAGVTTVRDLGCRGTIAQDLRDAIIAGREEGPRIVASGRPVTSPRGHLWSFGIEVRGAAAAREAVETLLAERVDLVKVIATGGALTPGTPVGRAQFDLDELGAVTGAAHAGGRAVAAHAHGTEGIRRAVAAGVDTVEHCSWADLGGAIAAPEVEVLERMARDGQMVVIAGPLVPAIVGRLGGAGAGAGVAVGAERTLAIWRNTRAAHRAGVGVALGTDSMFGQFADGHDLAYRAQALVEIDGWQPAEVLAMMTSAGARALKAEGRIGILAPGAFADLLVVAGDPLADIAALHRVMAVYANGRRVA